MKEVWGRFGMTAKLTEEEYEAIRTGEYDRDTILNLIDSGRLEMNGETYFPEGCGFDEEITLCL